MRTITLYRISLKDLGNRVTLKPKVPEYKLCGENNALPRICACPTVMGCIDALDLGTNDYFCELNHKLNTDPSGIEVYLYVAKVPIDNIIQPTINDVRDSWITGEFWIIDSQVFTLVSKYTIRKHMSFPNTALSRYVMQREDCGYDEIVDRILTGNIYGDMTQFSYIKADSSRKDLAEFHYHNNIDSYCPNFTNK